MHFGTFPLLPGTFQDFNFYLKEHKVHERDDYRLVDAYKEGLGKWIQL